MDFSIVEGFSKSLAMTVLSEIGDKTFFAAAILAMRHPRGTVLLGCLAALTVMTALSVLVGWAMPNLISRKWTHHIATLLFLGFGFWSLWEGFTEEGESEELAEVEAKLDSDMTTANGKSKPNSKADDDTKKEERRLLVHLFSPIFLKAFSITFFGEWGDKSQLATIGLASDENPLGVVLGGIIGQALCTTAAVVGGPRGSRYIFLGDDKSLPFVLALEKNGCMLSVFNFEILNGATRPDVRSSISIYSSWSMAFASVWGFHVEIDEHANEEPQIRGNSPGSRFTRMTNIILFMDRDLEISRKVERWTLLPNGHGEGEGEREPLEDS